MSNKNFTLFGIDGLLFGLFDPGSTSEITQVGNNCVVCIRVKSAGEEFIRLKEFSKISMPVNSVSHYRVFQIEDSEGNVVEFYSVNENG